jgi:tryptophan-rich sensory protein
MDIPNGLALMVFAVLCIGAASMGAIFRPGAWYESMDRPPWRPPNWLFGPAWAVLFLTMAAAAWMIWSFAPPGQQTVPLAWWGLQLALNACWSPIFFGLRRPGLAFKEVLLLWCAVLGTVISFLGAYPPAGWLLLPYLAWVSFASVLNHAMWRRNPQYG